MTNWFGGMGEVISAVLSNDAWELSNAISNNMGIWPLGLIVLLVLGVAILILYRMVPPIERYLEPTVMVTTYLLMGGIIFAGVIQRFFLDGQPSWSSTMPAWLFLIMAWFGCGYNVKLRTHLAFSEFRSNMSRNMQMFCLSLDAVLWIVFSWIVFVTGIRVTANSASNFSIVPGTDDTMQWWFLIVLPLSFALLTARALENWLTDYRNYKSGSTLISQAVIGGE
ncbi:MAG: TRAP transporter small permease [Hyphomicrobiales bacterium]